MTNNLRDAIEYATKHLPVNWFITLHVEKGVAWLELENDWGGTRYADNSGLSLEEQVKVAVDSVRKQ